MSRLRIWLGIATCALATLASPTRAAEDASKTFPNRAVRFIVPYPPGGSTTFTAREIALQLAESWGQQLVIDNRGGAGSLIGHQLAATATPDGYTIVLGTSSGLSIARALGTKLPYDPQKDFAPIGLAVYAPYIFVVHPSLPVTSIRSFIDYAQKNPGKLNYASSGAGTPNHLGGEMLDVMAGIKTVHIAYKGGGPAMIDLLAGQIQYMLSAFPQALPHVKTGRLRAIGVGHATRTRIAPDLPLIADVLPGFNNTTWYGLLAPAGTPKHIVARMNADLNKALAHPDLVRRMIAGGVEPAGGPPEALAAMMESETERWRQVINKAGLSAGAMQ
jgi:tripartite-type tricarboxylate transporter receptor subunit TctC